MKFLLEYTVIFLLSFFFFSILGFQNQYFIFTHFMKPFFFFLSSEIEASPIPFSLNGINSHQSTEMESLNNAR